MDSRRLAGIACLLGNVVCWGAIPVLLRELTDAVDGWTANGVRYPLSAALYWPLLAVAAARGKLTLRMFQLCLIPALLAFFGQICWGLAPYYLPASAIGFFVRLSMLWAVIGAMFLFQDERQLLRSPRFYLGMLLLIIGFVVMAGSKFRQDDEVTLLGICVILTCSLCFGLYGVSVRYLLGGIHPILAFGIVSQFVSVGTMIAMYRWGDTSSLESLDMRAMTLLVVSSVIGVALGHSLFYGALKRLGAAITSGGQTLAPFVTAVLALTFLQEEMTTLQWTAGTTMIVGVLLLVVSGKVDGPRPLNATPQSTTP